MLGAPGPSRPPHAAPGVRTLPSVLVLGALSMAGACSYGSFGAAPEQQPAPSSNESSDEEPVAAGPSAEPEDSNPPMPVDVDAPSVREGLAGRLTASQYDNVVLDVLGVTLQPDERDPSELGVPRDRNSTGLFSNGADGQPAADAYPLAFGRLAARVAARSDLSWLSASAACEVMDAACAGAFVAELGLRLFRRPLTERERSSFVVLALALADEGLSADDARRGVLEALLQSPHFLFRLERETDGEPGTDRALDGFELAARLSFFLWDSAPDDELLADAAAGTLGADDAAWPVVERQIERMLADPKARRMTRGFVNDFAEVNRAAFVGLTPELQRDLVESLVASVETHLWEDQRGFDELFTTTQMVFTPDVATHIGLTPSGEGLRRYDVSGLPQRVGWLTHPGFIAGFGEGQEGSIVHRGITLMVRLLCRQPIDVPVALAPEVASFNEEHADLTERERSEQRQRMALPVSEGGQGNPSCWSCHSQFEPLAYAFDRFDAAGRYRGEVDAEGRPLPIDGWLTDDLDVPEAERPRYAEMAQYMELLAASPVVQRCTAEHFLSLATGRAASLQERAFAASVAEDYASAGGTLPEIVKAVVRSHLFRKQRVSEPASAL